MIKRRRTAIVSGICLAFLLVQTFPVLAAGLEVSRDTLFVPGEVLVKLRPAKGVMAATVAQTLGTGIGGVVASISGDVALLSVSPSADVPGLIRRLSVQPEVRYAQPNYIYWIPEKDPRGKEFTRTEVTRNVGDKQIKISTRDLLAMRTRVGKTVTATYPGDSMSDWGFLNTSNNLIWSDLAPSPVVCVVDTGVDAKHPDLSGNVLAGFDFVNNDSNPDDDYGHGTHVSGVIAAKINNTTVPASANVRAGMSRSKILPVKVLSAQGWGTSFWIGRGVRYCADNVAVKVINMSLGGSVDDPYEYDSLYYATNTKGKLIVTSAGNDSTNAYSYPAAWSDANVAPPAGAIEAVNTVYNRILAVGAQTPYDTWVDTSGDGVEDADEIYANCAASFSNYGSWVEMVAPGEDIISTTPYNKPFYLNYYYGATGTSDWLSGTSMAAPYVAAGAARAWSVWPALTATQIKERLMTTGDALTFVEDPNRNGGYKDGGYSGDMPFCWPSEMAATSKSLNFASLMGREGMMGSLVDSTTGLPLMGSSVQLYQGAALRSTIAMTSPSTRFWDAINLPQNTSFTIKVTKAGYTTGAANLGIVTTGSGGYYWNDVPIMTGIPPSTKNTAVVVTSGICAPVKVHEEIPSAGSYDVDLFAWLPVATPGIVGGVLPTSYVEDLGPGALFAAPWAVWTRDGGWTDYLMAETVTVAPRIGLPNALYYPGEYNFFVYNWDAADSSEPNCNYDDSNPDLESACMEPLTFRVWRGGVIKDQFTIRNFEVDGPYGHCAANQFWFQPYKIDTMGNITRVQQCGDESILPYGTP